MDLLKDDDDLYEEIDVMYRSKLNKPMVRRLNTNLPAFSDLKKEVEIRREVKSRFEKNIKEKNFVPPKIEEEFVDLAMKNYIEEEYPSEDKKEKEFIIEKYLGKKSSSISRQFSYVVSGDEERRNKEEKQKEKEINQDMKKDALENAKKAIEEIAKYLKKKAEGNSSILGEKDEENEKVFLTTKLFRSSKFSFKEEVDLKKPIGQKNEHQICFITKDRDEFGVLQEDLVSQEFNNYIITIDDLSDYDKDKENQKKFINSYSYVVIDPSLKYDEKSFFSETIEILKEKKKLLFSPLESMINTVSKILNGTILNVSKGDDSFSTPFGSTLFSSSALLANLEIVLNKVLSTFYLKEIDSISITLKDLPPLFIFMNQNLPYKVVKELPKQMIGNKRNREEEDQKSNKKQKEQ